MLTKKCQSSSEIAQLSGGFNCIQNYVLCVAFAYAFGFDLITGRLTEEELQFRNYLIKRF